jgi:two-component system LytT family response regulator
MTLRTLVVDDDAPARERLITLLGEQSDIAIAGTCGNGPDAVDAIVSHRPDLVFLDVQMPEMSGFEVIDAVGVGAIPVLVFVTAWDAYALRAFEARAIDYLLKPFTGARFDEALQRVRRVLSGDHARQLHQQVEQLLGDVLPPPRERRLAARDGTRIVFLRLDEIDWIEGAGNYVRLYARGRHFAMRATLRQTSDRLRAAGFRRIHHSHIVNVERIASIEHQPGGDYVVVLETGTRLATSRAYTESVTSLL